MAINTEFNRGVKVIKTINKDYFKIGEAFMIRLEANYFVNAILKEATDEKIVFVYLEKGEPIELEMSVSDIIYRDHWITKLKPDYKDGKCKDYL